MKKKTTITTTKENLMGELKKNSIAHALFYGILVGIVASLLVFCYFSVFSSNFYLRANDACLVGVADSQKFESTNNGDLLFVQKYDDWYDTALGDQIYFSGNTGRGSGNIIERHVADGYLTIKTGEETYNVSLSTVLGKVVAKAGFWGYILYFFQSVAGIIGLNILLAIIVGARMILLATTETSAKGRELKAKLAEQKREYARRKKTHERYKSTSLDSDAFEILSGTHQENKKQLFEVAEKKDQANAYKFLLEKVYNAYLTKPQLTHDEQVKISNCIELMAVAYGFDMDVEYMINDLIIKCPVVDFDMQAFRDTCKEEIIKTKSFENLGRFCSSIYVLAKLNKCVRTSELGEICDAVQEKLADKKFAQKNEQAAEELQNLLLFIKKFIKK